MRTNILVLRFSSIGDIIQTTSVLNTVKKYLPNHFITYLTLTKYEPLLKNHPSIDALHSIDPKKDQTGLKKVNEIFNENQLPIIHNSIESYSTARNHTIAHFYEKLLLLKHRMETKTGKKIAEARH